MAPSGAEDEEGSLGLILALRDMSEVCPEAPGKRVWVKQIAPGAAAEGQVAPGDELRSIGSPEGTDVRRMVQSNNWELKDIAKSLSGPVGSTCCLTFFNHGLKKEYAVELKRSRIKALPARKSAAPEDSVVTQAVMVVLLVLLGMCVVVSLVLRMPAITAQLPDEVKRLVYQGLQEIQALHGGGLAAVVSAALVVFVPLLWTLTGIATVANSVQKSALCALIMSTVWASTSYWVDYMTIWQPPPELSLRGRTAVLTGPTTALGFEITKKLQALGATVVLACQDRPACSAALFELTQEFNPSDGAWTVTALKMDLCSKSSIEGFSSEFKSLYSRLDFLVLNVGDPECEWKGKDSFRNKHIGQTFLVNSLKTAMERNGEDRTRIVATTTSAQWFAPYDISAILDAGYRRADALGQIKTALETIAGVPAALLSNVCLSHELSKQWHNKSDDSGVITASVGVGIVGISEFGASLVTKIANRFLAALLRPSGTIALPVIYALVAPNSEIGSGRFIDAQGKVVPWYPGGPTARIASQLWASTEESLME